MWFQCGKAVFLIVTKLYVTLVANVVNKLRQDKSEKRGNLVQDRIYLKNKLEYTKSYFFYGNVWKMK